MVKLIKKTPELATLRSQEKSKIGFVPTMGNLHAGHISLLEKALSENDTVYFSIFVNPKQFGPKDDFQKYPRTLEFDLSLIQQCESKYPGKQIIVFAPESPQEIFPLNNEQTVAVPTFNNIIEGKFRPDHFDGVSTVVYRLFEIIKPHKAYFGLKDYQQFLVIRRMVRDLALPIEIVGMPIIREDSGLALSSRNQYLTPEQKQEALVLSQSLNKIAKLIDGKKANLPKAKREIDALMMDPKWNYLEMRDAETLSEDLTNSKCLTLVAVYQLGTTRLLDNLQMEIE
ncbi:MAG: pantoate--beta-alanine ligase [Bdellovibrionales bacterium]|nr:pantoate--beta-alanine ligase [Bdellovibrionales bacterium]